MTSNNKIRRDFFQMVDKIREHVNGKDFPDYGYSVVAHYKDGFGDTGIPFEWKSIVWAATVLEKLITSGGAELYRGPEHDDEQGDGQ